MMTTFFSSQIFKNVRYYASYQLIYVVIGIILSSIGAFFHFLLDHEISIVESWLHNNHWELLIVAKLLSLFIINRWFTVRLYEVKTIRQLVKELVKWPEPKALVISIFMFLGYLTLGKVTYVGQNLGYWYFHMVSFIGLFLFFGIEFIVIAYLDDVLNENWDSSRFILSFFYIALFIMAYKMSIPDYYSLLPYVVLCYTTLIFLSGKSFKSWSNVLCFLLLFVAPMGSFFGMDPIWGDDFSPFKLDNKLSLAFLAVIWMVSFGYYKYRDVVVSSIQKFIR